MTIYPTLLSGGANVEMAIETTLGTPGSYLDFRPCEDTTPEFPTDTREVRSVSTRGNWDPSEREAQLSYELGMENAGTVSTYITGASSAAGTPQCIKLFEAAGCTIVAGEDTPDTLSGYTSTIAWAGGANTPIAGQVGILQDTAGARWPYLTYSNSGAAAYNIVPTMAIPVASSSGYDVNKAWTVTPPKGVAVSSSKTLAFRLSGYYPTSTETGSCWVYTGCAVGEVKPIVFESGSPLKMECSIHVAKRAFDQSGIDLTAEAFIDAVAVPHVDGAAGFLMGYANLGAYPQATARTTGIRKATWNPGIKTYPIRETGASTSINSWGGYLAAYTGSTIEIVADVEKDYWTRLESSGSQTAKYLELVQKATASTATSFGLWMPKCYMVGKPKADLWGEKEMTVTFTLEPSSAGITSTSKTAQGNQPWYFAVSPVWS
jgi:hypothetical protein